LPQPGAMADASNVRHDTIVVPETMSPAPVRAPVSVAAEIGEAWRLMLDVGGRVRVTDLADDIGWSRRHFSARFRSETGLTPCRTHTSRNVTSRDSPPMI
jgi:transcriptional regulator GlxA family with amidase domain